MNAIVDGDLRHTPLFALHRELGAKMVPFAGYEMPVQYPTGILKEHLHTRQHAGLFDVSHMGQRILAGPDYETTARALEALTPGDFENLAKGRQRYSMLLNDEGGIVDDLMATRPLAEEEEGEIRLVVNAGRKDVDDRYIRERLPDNVRLISEDERALLALQGPQSEQVMARHSPAATRLSFMGAMRTIFDGIEIHVSRSGYTGEDGFEISVEADYAEQVARALLAEPEVLAIGLGARDSLRLEAGLCLYGHDIDETKSPVEAGLTWAIGKRRKLSRDFPGAARITYELHSGTRQKRVGIRPADKAPAREGVPVLDQTGETVGVITSGGFGPSLGGPVAMGYVDTGLAEDGTDLSLLVRGAPRAARISPLPFVPHRYKRTAENS